MDKFVTIGACTGRFSIKHTVSLLFIVLLSSCIPGFVIHMFASGQEPVIDTGTPQGAPQGTAQGFVESSAQAAPQGVPQGASSENLLQAEPPPAEVVSSTTMTSTTLDSVNKIVEPTQEVRSAEPTTVEGTTPEPQKHHGSIQEEAPKPVRTGTILAEASPDVQPLAAVPSKVDSDDFEESFGLPGAQYEFRVEVGGGGVECFYQKFKKGAQVHLSFQVMRGADKNIDLMVRDPNNAIIEQIQWTSESSWNGVIETEGIHSVCFDNSHSRFSSKLVYFYLIGYVEEDWKKFAEESQKYIGGIENFTTYLMNVDQKLNKMAVMQATSRRHMIKDFYVVISNKLHVQNLSLIMCAIIVVCAAFQVYFVRRLFNTGSSHMSKGHRPRA